MSFSTHFTKVYLLNMSTEVFCVRKVTGQRAETAWMLSGQEAPTETLAVWMAGLLLWLHCYCLSHASQLRPLLTLSPQSFSAPDTNINTTDSFLSVNSLDKWEGVENCSTGRAVEDEEWCLCCSRDSVQAPWGQAPSTGQERHRSFNIEWFIWVQQDG